MIYAFVDTNIFIRIATQGRPGCEHRHFEDLQTLVESDALELLLPEVVLLEMEKSFRSLSRDIESNCDKLRNSVLKATEGTWSEIESLKQHLLTQIAHFKEEQITKSGHLADQILAFLNSEKVTRIRLSADILVDAKRRLIAGTMPVSKKTSDQDAIIIESLSSHLTGPIEPAESFLFCTENTKDFGLEVSSQKLNRRFILDPQIQLSLPRAQFSTDLASMLNLFRGYEELPTPTNEEIRRAIGFRDEHEDIDDELFSEAHQLLCEAVNREATRQFETQIAASMPSDVNALREQLLNEVRELLVKCRACKSWGDRSEYKLPQWIEYVNELMIPYTSVPRLVRIKTNLDRYLEVHRSMDRSGD